MFRAPGKSVDGPQETTHRLDGTSGTRAQGGMAWKPNSAAVRTSFSEFADRSPFAAPNSRSVFDGSTGGPRASHSQQRSKGNKSKGRPTTTPSSVTNSNRTSTSSPMAAPSRRLSR